MPCAAFLLPARCGDTRQTPHPNADPEKLFLKNFTFPVDRRSAVPYVPPMTANDTNQATNPMDALRDAVRSSLAAGANLVELIEAANTKAEANKGTDSNNASMVRAALIDVYAEREGVEAADLLMDRLGM